MDDDQFQADTVCEDGLDGFALYASSQLKLAVSTASISRSHGMLLAALREDVQDAALAGLQSMDLLPGVGELRASIQGTATPLQDACFEKKDCVSCRFNSDNHGMLFELTIGPGHCVNSACAAEKTKERLEAEAVELRGKYRVVEIAPVTTHKIEIRGENSVGETQARACQESCVFYGAAVKALPGHQIQVETDVCTNNSCHSAMVTKWRREEMAEFKARMWKTALAKHIEALPLKQHRAITLGLLALGWSTGDRLALSLKLPAESSVSDVIAAVVQMDDEVLTQGLNLVCRALIGSATPHQTAEALRSLKVRLQDHWFITGAFLERLSFEELDDVSKDLGLKSSSIEKARLSGSRLTYAKALSAELDGSKSKGYIPECLRY